MTFKKPKRLFFLPVAVFGCAGILAVATAGPVVVENGGFTDKKTGAQFFPVGFNYVDLRTNDDVDVFHDTYNPNRYDSATASAKLSEIAAGGFNTVRVFTETKVGPSGVALTSSDTELSPGYMQSVADFLEQARAHGIYVLITFESFPWTTRYAAYVDSVPNVEWMNTGYLNPGHIAAKRLYMADFIQKLYELAPDRMADTVMAFDPQNEVCHYLSAPPFSLSSGSVTPANGITYDLATDKVQLADEMAVYWTDQMAEEIHLQAPGALVDINVFTYHAVGRSIGDFSLYGTTNAYDWRDRYPFRPEALAASGADLLDLHFYTGNATDLQNDLNSIEFSATSNAWNAVGKPMIVGEFGAFKFAFPVLSGAALWKRAETDIYAANGFQGWLYWTYDSDPQEQLWNAKSGSGEIFDAMEEGAKVNYFGYPTPADDSDGDDLPDSWEISSFWTLAHGANDDPDGDGIANRAEYLAGTHPNLSTSKFEIVGGQADGTDVWVQWSTVSGKTYQLMRTESLADPCWSAVDDPVDGTGSPVSRTVSDGANQGFYKVRVNLGL